MIHNTMGRKPFLTIADFVDRLDAVRTFVRIIGGRNEEDEVFGQAPEKFADVVLLSDFRIRHLQIFITSDAYKTIFTNDLERGDLVTQINEDLHFSVHIEITKGTKYLH